MEQLIGLLIFVVLFFLKAIFETIAAARKGKNSALQEQEAAENLLNERVETAAAKRPTKNKGRRRKQPKEREYVLELEDEPVRRRGTLNKELNPLGEGNRIEAAPGTLHTPQLAAATLRTKIKPELESLTGIYDIAPDSSEQKIQPLDLSKMLTQPDGIRQGIIWAEILKRPNG